MLIVALVLAVIGLAALVTAVVTSNELIAWVCIAASVVGVLLLIVDALRERSRREAPAQDAGAASGDTREEQDTQDAGTADDSEAGPESDAEAGPTAEDEAGFDAEYPDEEHDEGPDEAADTLSATSDNGEDEVVAEEHNNR